MPRSTETFLAYCCSVCDETYPTERRCQQHCSQPHSACNRGRARHEFATPVPIRVRVEGHRGRIVGGQVTRFQNGRGGRGGDGGSPTQEICGGPASTDGENAFEGSAWNLDDDEEPDREGPFIDIYNI